MAPERSPKRVKPNPFHEDENNPSPSTSDSSPKLAESAKSPDTKAQTPVKQENRSVRADQATL